MGTVLALIRTDGEATRYHVPRPEQKKPKSPSRLQPPPAARRQPVPLAAVAPPPDRGPPNCRRVRRKPPSGRLRVSPLAMRISYGVGSRSYYRARHRARRRYHQSGCGEAPPKPFQQQRPSRRAIPAAPPAEEAKLSRRSDPAITPADRHAAMRKAIAAAMARSKREIPHYYLGTHIDMSRALAWLQAENLKRPVTERLLYSVLLLKAVALAVHEIPDMNGFWVDGAFKPSEAVHVGVAISLRQGGLIAPAIHDLDKKSLDEIMGNLRDLGEAGARWSITQL